MLNLFSLEGCVEPEGMAVMGTDLLILTSMHHGYGPPEHHVHHYRAL
jgi:hypothetical protein